MSENVLQLIIMSAVLFIFSLFTGFMGMTVYRCGGIGDKFIAVLLWVMALVIVFVILCLWMIYGGM